MRAALLGIVVALALTACSAQTSPPNPLSLKGEGEQVVVSRDAGATNDVTPPAPQADGGRVVRSVKEQAPIAPRDAAATLFLAEAARADVAACEGEAAPIPCLLHLRYAGDPEAEKAALGFFERRGSVAGLEPESMFDGGWRGTIRLVPELPVGRYRRHLVDVAAAVDGLDDFVAEVTKRAPAPVRYRARDIRFRFFRSVGRTTPSAFAEKWSIGYNVSGSLLGTAKGVRETLVHEIFHLNDEGRGPGGESWSSRALGAVFDGIVARCGTRSACLGPYAPGDTMVRGGTYYAFQPGGGVHEYAAELAVRYVRETEAALGRSPAAGKPFKCGPAENGRAWRAVVDEFFGGLDLTPGCER